MKSTSPTRKSFWAYAGILLAVSAWMFFLGVLVGRGTAPVKFDIHKLEQTLLKKRMEADTNAKESIPADYQHENDKDDTELYEALKTYQPNELLTAETPDPEEKAGTAPESEPEPEPKPAEAAKKSDSSGRLYTVQVASLRSKESAQSIVQKLLDSGYDAYVASSSSSAAGTWYRVRVGHFDNKAAADALERKLKRESFAPIVVQRR